MSKDLIEKHLEEAKNAIAEAVKLADQTGEHFSFSFGSPVNVRRGIGGDYVGKGAKMHPEAAYYETYEEYVGNDEPLKVEEIDDLNDWEDYEDLEEVTLSEGYWSAWQSSSEQC